MFAVALGISFLLPFAIGAPFWEMFQSVISWGELNRTYGGFVASLLSTIFVFAIPAGMVYVLLALFRIKKLFSFGQWGKLVLYIGNSVLSLYYLGNIGASSIQGGGASYVYTQAFSFLVIPFSIIVLVGLLIALITGTRTREISDAQ